MQELNDLNSNDYLLGRQIDLQRQIEDAEQATTVEATGGGEGDVAILRNGIYQPGTITGTSGQVAFTPSGTGYTISLAAAGTLRTYLGLGALALLGPAPASPDTAAPVGAAYSQPQVQAILDELRDLKTQLRNNGQLTP